MYGNLKMRLIYSLDKKYNEIFNEISESGEICDSDLQKIKQIDNEKSLFILNFASMIKNLEIELENISEVIENFKDRKTAVLKKIDIMKDELKKYFIENDINKIKGIEFDVKILKNKFCVNILNANEIPKYYIKEKIVTSIDKKSILEDLKSGLKVDGVLLSQNIRIDIR